MSHIISQFPLHFLGNHLILDNHFSNISIRSRTEFNILEEQNCLAVKSDHNIIISIYFMPVLLLFIFLFIVLFLFILCLPVLLDTFRFLSKILLCIFFLLQVKKSSGCCGKRSYGTMLFLFCIHLALKILTEKGFLDILFCFILLSKNWKNQRLSNDFYFWV